MSTKKRENVRLAGLFLQILTSALCIVLGVLLLFVDSVELPMICYGACIGIIIVGIFEIIYYFASKAYRRLNDYNFAIGIFFMILGIIGMIRIEDLTTNMETYMAIVSLILGVLIVQSSVQLKVLKNDGWYFDLIMAVITILASIISLADVKIITENIQNYTYWVLMLSGILNLISLLLSMHAIQKYAKQVKAKKKQPQKETAQQKTTNNNDVESEKKEM